MTPAISLLHVHGTNAEAIGYGRLGVKLAEALRRMGIAIYDHLPEPEGFRKGGGHALGYDAGRTPGIGGTICWISTPAHARGWWEGQRPVLLTMWEATKLPESFREALHEFDLIFVPSPQNVELFSRYHPNVKLLPLGFDPADWRYVPRTPPGPWFEFLTAGSGARKGTALVVDAFLELWGEEGSWGSGPIPRLTVKAPRGDVKSRSGWDVEHPRINLVAGKIPPEEEVALYASAHCYVGASRGEGFGLQPLQAIAQGCPTILTGAHGHETFMHLGWPVRAEMAPASYFIYGDAGEWWEPDFEQLKAEMAWAYHHCDSAFLAARNAAFASTRQFTWDRVAANFVDLLGGMDALAKPGPEPVTWHAPVNRLYQVRVNRRIACDIAGLHHQFDVGVDYWQTADVKRILFESGHLDPACCAEGSEGDIGLSPGQVARAGRYQAEHARCSQCRQLLNIDPTRDDLPEET